MGSSRQLIAVLREARECLARADNDFWWSSWEDASAAFREIDGLIARIESGDMPSRSDVEVLFLPTGPIQEVSFSSGWDYEFLALADRFDMALARAYRTSILSQIRRALPRKWRSTRGLAGGDPMDAP